MRQRLHAVSEEQQRQWQAGFLLCPRFHLAGDIVLCFFVVSLRRTCVLSLFIVSLFLKGERKCPSTLAFAQGDVHFMLGCGSSCANDDFPGSMRRHNNQSVQSSC